MFQFDTNFLQFLTILSQKKDISGITALANTSGLSRRMIYYYIEKVDDLFKSVHLPPVQKQARGKIKISAMQQKKIKEWLQNQGKQEYVWSTNERRLLITLLLLVENRKWQLKHFQALFMVSRNTVLADIQWVKELLMATEISLESNKERGYYIQVSELERRQLIFQQLYFIETGQKESFYPFLIDALKFEQTQERIEQVLRAIEKIIMATKEILNKEITAQDGRILAKLIYLLQYRSKAGFLPEWSHEEELIIQERLEYHAAKKMIDRLTPYVHADFIEKEALYYGMLLLCIEKNVDAHFMSNPFENLVDVTENFITLFEKIAGIHFHHRKRLIEKVQTHMKVLYYRHIFGMQLLQHVGVSVKEQYQKVFQLIEKVSNLMKSDVVFQLSFPDGFSKNELSELAMFFEEAILREQSRRDVPQVLIVSDYSDVLNSLLESHVRQILPHVSIVGILKTDVAHLYPGKVDFCISTDTKYMHNQGETLFVSIILTQGDKKRIKNIRKEATLKVDKRKKILSLMNQFHYLTNQEAFLNELEKIIEIQPDKSVVRQTTQLVEFMQKSHFQFTRKNVQSFDEILQIIAQPLLKENYIQTTYIEQIKKELEANHFTFLFPKILLLHTDYRFGSMKPGCSFLYLETPFVTATMESVQLVVFISTEESMAHVPLLFELDQILSHHFLRFLIAGKTFSQAYQLSLDDGDG